MGLTTHVAARLKQAARPDTVRVAAETRRLAGEAVQASPRGAVAVKGLADPVEAYELVGLERADGDAGSIRNLIEDQRVGT